MKDILSLGHSNIGWDEFHYALSQFDIGCIIDVRSSPRSRWRHFNRPELRGRLNTIGISYIHLGDALGGLPQTGAEDYDTRRGTTAFATAIESVLAIAARCRPALLCSERDALQCHRFLLISRHLHNLPDVRVSHIHHDGTLESHAQAEERLLTLHKLAGDLFVDHADRVAEAYARQERKFG